MRTIALSLILCVASLAEAQCGSCAVPSPSQPIAGYEWRAYHQLPADLYLFQGGQQIGALHIATGTYRAFANGQWTVGQPPTAVPAGYSAQPNFGVDTSRLQSVESAYSKDGKWVSQEEAYKALEKTVPDDVSKLRLTVIGSKDERAPVLAELEKPESADLKAAVNLWAVDADHWSVKESATGKAMYASGHPSIYLQAPSGKVLHRQDGFKAGDLQVIRKVANYDHKKDPNLNAPLAAGLGPSSLLLAGAGAAACGLLGLNRFRRPQS